ncbi:hypothetical protein L3Q82_021940, partial [Scortum barcoo]
TRVPCLEVYRGPALEPSLGRWLAGERLVGLTSTHSAGSGTKILESSWAFFYAGVAPGWGCVLTVFCCYAPNSRSEYPPFLGSLGWVLDSAPTGDHRPCLLDFNAHVGNDNMTWRGVIGRNGLPDQNSRKWCSVIGLLC